MIRTLLAAALLLPALVIAVVRTSPAIACSVGPPLLGDMVADADFIALVDVLEVGGADNPLPTLSPDPTFTPSPSFTPAMPAPTLRPLESTPTPMSIYPRPTHTPVDLTGIGARAGIVQSVVGQPNGDIDLDTESRREVEIRAREVEALDPILIPPCHVTIGYAHFAPGNRYLVFASEGGARVHWWNPIVDGPSGTEHIDAYFMLPRATYDRFFPPIAPEYYTDDGSGVYVGREDLPLTTILAIIADVRGDPTAITPPETGTAGLQDPTP